MSAIPVQDEQLPLILSPQLICKAAIYRPRSSLADKSAPTEIILLQRADICVGRQVFGMGVFAAGRAVRVSVETQFAEFTGEGVIGHHATHQRLANVEQELDRLGRLQDTDDAGQHAQHARLGAAWSQRHRGRLWIETAIARPLVRFEDGQLPLETEDAAMNDGLVGDDGGVVEQVARREVVSAIDDQIVVGDDARNIGLVQPLAVGDDLNLRVERLNGLASRLGLVLANTTGVVQNLALQVAVIHHVGVDDADGANTGGGQVIRGGRAEATGADEQHLRVEQLELTGLAYFGNEHMAAVAPGLRIGHQARLHKGKAAILPLAVAARHGDSVLVAHLLQRAAGHQRAHAARTVENHRFGLVGNGLFNLQFKEATRDMNGARNMAFIPLVLLTHIYKDNLLLVGAALLIEGLFHL